MVKNWPLDKFHKAKLCRHNRADKDQPFRERERERTVLLDRGRYSLVCMNSAGQIYNSMTMDRVIRRQRVKTNGGQAHLQDGMCSIETRQQKDNAHDKEQQSYKTRTSRRTDSLLCSSASHGTIRLRLAWKRHQRKNKKLKEWQQ